jgi:site-specific recombinase XerD
MGSLAMGGQAMKRSNNVATLIEHYFTERLMRQRDVSANTITSYRDAFRLLFTFAQTRLRKAPSSLELKDLEAPFISTFLADLETKLGASVRTRNLRLTAIRSFFRFVSFKKPAHSALIQRVLAIPNKRHDKRQVHFLTRPEIEAILAVPDRTTWLGRRDHTLLLLAAQTGLRLSELIGLDRDALRLGAGAHVRVIGKGRKERYARRFHGDVCALVLGQPIRQAHEVCCCRREGANLLHDLAIDHKAQAGHYRLLMNVETTTPGIRDFHCLLLTRRRRGAETGLTAPRKKPTSVPTTPVQYSVPFHPLQVGKAGGELRSKCSCDLRFAARDKLGRDRRNRAGG